VICFSNNLFKNSPKWEIRHGATLGLRELLKVHKNSIGKNCFAKNEKELQEQNENWLEHCLICLLKVLILDRFSDFVSDLAVSPVQETCSQVIGILVQKIPLRLVKEVYKILLLMLKNEKWEVISCN
jgi:TATA-binding protein-associated factor